jgi:hypothetical protein
METKAWYESKIVWAGVVTTLIGALGVVQEVLAKGPVDQNAVILMASGVLTVIFRVWFTTSAIKK